MDIAKRSVLVAAAILSLSALAGCSDDPIVDPRVITELTPELRSVVEGNNEFAWALYHEAGAGSNGNLFFSPFSISAAYGMTWAGAGGDTADEMRSVLEVRTEDDAAYHKNFGALVRDLGGPHLGRGYQLSIASRLFGQSGTPFRAEFISLTDTAYGAPLDLVDYNADPDDARQRINKWVSDQTGAKIPELIGPGKVSNDTRLVLANAIYFKADWAEKFDPARTADTDFTLADGSKVRVPMMTSMVKARTSAREDVRLLELPYRDNEVSMVVILPPTADGLPALEASMDAASIDELLAQTYEHELPVSLPRFEVGAELPLADLMKKMGIVRAFDPTQADFSKMLNPPVEALFLGFSVHKAYVRVDEEGTEAAAATANGIFIRSATMPFVADHPFVYLIRDRLTGSILFLGRMADPTDTGGL